MSKKAAVKKTAAQQRNPYNVTVGEVWQSNDRRDRGRKVKVVEIKKDKARCSRLDPDGFLGPSTWIRLDRFKPNASGFVLVVIDEVPDEVPDPTPEFRDEVSETPAPVAETTPETTPETASEEPPREAVG